jgi:hypothetical protein
VSRQGVDYEQAGGLGAMVAPAVRGGGRKPKCLSSRDSYFRRAVFELVLDLAAEHVARVGAVAPLRASGSGRVLDERPPDAVDDLLDVTDIGVVLRRRSVEGHHPRRERIGAHHAIKLKRTPARLRASTTASAAVHHNEIARMPGRSGTGGLMSSQKIVMDASNQPARSDGRAVPDGPAPMRRDR